MFVWITRYKSRMQADWSQFFGRWFRFVLCLAVCGLALLLGRTNVVCAFEYRLYDLRVKALSSFRPASQDIVLITLDNKSLAERKQDLGRWPWSRAVFASILDYCSEAAAIGFDILFAEPDWQWPEHDQLLTDGVRAHGRVVMPMFFEQIGRSDSELHEDLKRHRFSLAQVDAMSIPDFEDVLLPFEGLLQGASALGHVNHKTDSDGVARSYMTVVRLGGHMNFPSMALSMAAMAKGNEVQMDPSRLSVAGRNIPITAEGRLKICYTDCRYPTYSLTDVLASWQAESQGLQPPISKKTFRNKLVMLGSTATGLMEDMEVTPVTQALPGVVIHAVALDNLLTGTGIREVPWLVFAGGVLLLSMIPAFSKLDSPKWMLSFGTLVFVLFSVAAITLVFVARIMMPLTAPLLGLTMSAGMLSLLYWYRERRRRGDLERLEVAKQQFTDMLVHDLKNRVAAITMALTMMDRTIDDDDPVLMKMLVTSQASAMRLLDQVRALLDIRKMEEGRMVLEKVRCNAVEVLDDCAREYHAAADVVDLELTVESDEHLAVSVDRDIFSRILGNLVWNALQYAKRGSHVFLTARVGQRDSSRVELVVANQGRNIPLESMDRMFELFSSGPMKNKVVKAHSTGLGLAFCRLACEAHDGAIRIESPWEEGDDGVKVIVDLPMAESPDGSYYESR